MRNDTESREDLQRCVARFHGVSLERVLGEIEYLRDPGDSVVAGGSLAYGLGNQLSDLDLVIIGPVTVESSRVPLEHFIGSLRVDVWKLSQRLIEESLDRAEQALAGEDPLLGSFGDSDHEDELKLLHRIAFGVVIDGHGLEPRLGRDYRTVASRLVVREYAERMRTAALLAQLALQAGRPVAAVVNARFAVEGTLNATIAHRGLPFSGDKWLRERLANQTADLACIYEPFRQLPENPTRDAAQFVEAALAACMEMWGLDLAIDTLVPAASWRNTDLQVVEIGTHRLLLSVRVGALWSLDGSDTETWQRLVAAGAGALDATWSLGENDAAALSLCLRLHEHGLLDLRWTEGVASEPLGRKRSVEVET
jgi:Nucleotidyltransferase domain